MHRNTSLSTTLILLLSLFAALGAQAGDDDQPPTDLTTIGQAIIGFHPGHMPDVHIGEAYLGFEVIKIVERGHFIVVDALRLDPVQARTDNVDAVSYVEDNALLHTLYVPDDTRYDDQWGPAPMGFETAWDTTLGSSDIIVAVLDTGIRKSHNDFTDALMMQGYDYVNNDNNPNDDCGHGTHVSGTVGATTGNALGVAGMSQSSIWHGKVLSPFLFGITCSGSNADIADAIYDATDVVGAHIISMSLGGASGSATLKNAVDHAWNNGVVVVAAAGNDNGGSVNYPAAYESVIAVSALDQDLTIASYSSVGPQVEITAPGSNVLSTYNSNDNSYSSLSGTSMAAPHVAGALALAFSAAPDTTGAQMRQALADTAEDLGAAGRDNLYGHGLARIDLLIDHLGGGGGGPGPQPPSASFTYTTTDLAADFDASASSDPDGSIVSYEWDFGDGNTGSGVTSSHTYAATGTYSVTLTVTDDNGTTDTDTQDVSVDDGSDPDPSTPTVQSGEEITVEVQSGQDDHYKVFVPDGSGQLQVVMDGPNCGLLSCPVDADLYTRLDQRATDNQYDCRPFASGSDETCTHNNPTGGWWYIRIDGYSGSGTVTFVATVS